MKRKLEAWGVLIAAAVGAFSIGFIPTKAVAAEPTPSSTLEAQLETIEAPLVAKDLPPVGGQFCAKKEHGMVARGENGQWYRCVRDGEVWRWKPTASPNPTTKPKPSKTTKKPATQAPAQGSGTNNNPPTLPRTGASTPYIVGTGLVIVIAGGLLTFAARTRRVRVEK